MYKQYKKIERPLAPRKGDLNELDEARMVQYNLASECYRIHNEMYGENLQKKPEISIYSHFDDPRSHVRIELRTSDIAFSGRVIDILKHLLLDINVLAEFSELDRSHYKWSSTAKDIPWDSLRRFITVCEVKMVEIGILNF